MSYAPSTLLEARAYVQAKTGLPANSLGIVGGPSHGGEGYHVGLDRLLAAYGYQDYSVTESPRDASPTNAAMAFDIGQFDRLRAMSIWIVEQCIAGAPDTLDIREVIYSPDGARVLRWDRLGIRTGGDSSHLTHSHISYFRDSETRDKIALFRRYFEGDTDMGKGVDEPGLDVVENRSIETQTADLWSQEMWNDSAFVPGSGPSLRGQKIQATLDGVNTLLERPAVPPIELTPEQIEQVTAALAEPIAELVAVKLAARIQS